MALIDLIAESRTVIILERKEVVLVTEPQKVDSPRDILDKYARGLPIQGFTPSYQSDDVDDDDRLLDSEFFEDEFDQRQFVKDYATQQYSPSEEAKTAVNQQTVEKGVEVPPKEETPV